MKNLSTVALFILAAGVGGLFSTRVASAVPIPPIARELLGATPVTSNQGSTSFQSGWVMDNSGGQLFNIGVMTSTGTSVSQATTATPFSIPCPGNFQIQCDAAVVISQTGTASTTITSASYGVRLAGQDIYQLTYNQNSAASATTDGGVPSCTLAMISITGTANCVVNQLK